MFGAKNHRMAKEFAGLVGGISSRAIMQMPKTHQVLLVNGTDSTGFSGKIPGH
jgi:hypothetical protein